MELESGTAPTKGLKCSWRHSAGWINNSQSAYRATAGESTQSFSTSVYPVPEKMNVDVSWEKFLKNGSWATHGKFSHHGMSCALCFPGHTWNKNDLDKALLIFSSHAMKILYQDSTCTDPRVFLMSLLCSINSDRLQDHRQHIFSCESMSGQSGLHWLIHLKSL